MGTHHGHLLMEPVFELHLERSSKAEQFFSYSVWTMTQVVPFLWPDYIQCPHCSRRFNEAAAQRHIKFCEEQAIRRAFAAKTTRQALVRKHSHTCLVLEADLPICNLWWVKTYINIKLEIPRKFINSWDKGWTLSRSSLKLEPFDLKSDRIW